MRKICLSLVGLYFWVFGAFAQDSPTADSSYKKRKLKFEEANLVSSYYSQDGQHAAVTGGIGSQQLHDYSNSIDLRFSRYDRLNRKHSYSVECGIDHYSSASSDKIDPTTISSASHADTRIYPSLSWTRENEQNGRTIGAGGYVSSEFDYLSLGGNMQFVQKTKNKNGEFSVKLQAYIDRVSLIYPIELRSGTTQQHDEEHYATASRNSFSATLAWSQIVNRNLQVLLEAEAVNQNGYLGLPFNRVYFADNSVHIEHLPGNRFKLPVGLRANYFLGDRLVLRAWYRFYKDSWNISSNTAQIEASVKLSPFFSITPFYRFYDQHGTNYFAAYRIHTSGDTYYSSNYDLSSFTSHFYGAGLRLAPPHGILDKHLSALELRYGHYQKNIAMNANILSLQLTFK